ncbi:elongation factor P [Candidatus Roizmanbacteria bacterium CG22_combo_CG10-13_8_21_14_all_38_20]|uniref:Elongation factor P n=1 Tax=Candidatus Roizmanbacteria bacterium CG22_combo_CG10-13_8_21_14_all_38_20 TaxID=1974862 RepID=A0A2H0BWF1_9BACT|nr:elongation factor P [Candidatus Microgenomates bacterium]PIP61308.1 MAG: elongation factor P [Candidatus Roizmanbacteria bacterium CG22_combo_CG10-13_8_21_14_all_38_20]PJC30620.1 MAG: elongation factor P [Candidatus Roizmanbacteria bacterium CG_4_9_14_0_2_um_filter_38_17]
MINISDLRPGNIYSEDGSLYQVLEYMHQKIARGTGKVVLKAKNLTTGSTLRKAYQSGIKVEPVQLETSTAQFLYVGNQDQAVFLDTSTYEQFEVEVDLLEGKMPYLKEGMEVTLRKHEEVIVEVTLPIKHEYMVSDAPPDARGDTSGGGGKEVTIETGAMVRAPMFIKKGDMIRVDTRNGKYIERVK